MLRLAAVRFLLLPCVFPPLFCQTGDIQPAQFTFSSLSADLYGLIASGAVAANWNGTMLPLHFVNGDVAEFDVTVALRVPGFTECSLWNTSTQLAEIGTYTREDADASSETSSDNGKHLRGRSLHGALNQLCLPDKEPQTRSL
jgi:hypothetical protein